MHDDFVWWAGTKELSICIFPLWWDMPFCRSLFN